MITSAVVIAARRAVGLDMLAAGHETPYAPVTEIAEVRGTDDDDDFDVEVELFASRLVPLVDVIFVSRVGMRPGLCKWQTCH